MWELYFSNFMLQNTRSDCMWELYCSNLHHRSQTTSGELIAKGLFDLNRLNYNVSKTAVIFYPDHENRVMKFPRLPLSSCHTLLNSVRGSPYRTFVLFRSFFVLLALPVFLILCSFSSRTQLVLVFGLRCCHCGSQP